jgi:hypothetical protein
VQLDFPNFSGSLIQSVYKKTHIQGVSEINTLILTGNRTHQKEQLFSLPFRRKTLRSGLRMNWSNNLSKKLRNSYNAMKRLLREINI